MRLAGKMRMGLWAWRNNAVSDHDDPIHPQAAEVMSIATFPRRACLRASMPRDIARVEASGMSYG